MAYGNAIDVQELVWGTAKANAPAGVTTALESATSKINIALNIRVELTGDDLPSEFTSIANNLAAGILQEQRDPRQESQRTIMGKQMLNDYRDQTSSKTRGESYHIGYVEP